MSAIDIEFTIGNQLRAYPLDDQATQIADGDIPFPQNLLIDCHLWMPAGDQRRAFVSAMTVSEHLVTVMISSTGGRPTLPAGGPLDDDEPGAYTPLATIVVQKPIDVARLYPLSGVIPGVGGWVAFGNGVNEPGPVRVYAFADHRQSILVPCAAEGYEAIPISSLGKDTTAIELGGLVNLIAGRNITIRRGTWTINGTEREAIAIGLDADTVDAAATRDFMGNCLGSPEGDTCRVQPIYSINEVRPDCLGNLDIEVEGAELFIDSPDQGLAVETTMGMDALCQGSPGSLPIMVPAAITPLLLIFTEDLPYVLDDETGTPIKLGTMRIRSGQFIVENCQLRPSAFQRSCVTVSVNSYSRDLHVEVKLLSYSPQRNAFLVFCWLSELNYKLAGLWVEPGSNIPYMVIGEVSGGVFTILKRQQVDVSMCRHYAMDLSIVPVSTAAVLVTLVVEDVGVMSRVVITSMGDGLVGMATEGAISQFFNFAVDWVQAYPALCAEGAYGEYAYYCSV